MKSYDELKSLIEKRGVHAEFGEPGEGWGIEQSSFELATFLVRMQEIGVQSVLEIGTGYKGGLSRFMAHDMGWDVTTVDVEDYGHKFEGINYIITTKDVTADEIQESSQLEFDLVFIDGAHDYMSVNDNYFSWAEFATKAIAFHDIVGLRNCEGAAKFWRDLVENGYAEDFAVREIVDESPRKSGIGLVETDDPSD